MPYTSYEQMPASARVWIYQCPKPLTDKQEKELEVHLHEFVNQWTSHHEALSAWGGILHHQFIVLAVDEAVNAPGGCSIDKSVAFIRQVQSWLGVDLFDRWNFAYLQNGEVKTAQRDDFSALYARGEINDSTIVFNNLVATKGELEGNWQIPLANSWHKNFA